MEYKKITSPSNERIKRAAKLSGANYFAKKENLMVLDGRHIVREFIEKNSDKNMESLFVSSESNQEIDEILKDVSSDRVIEVTEEIMKKISPTINPQGILAIVKREENSEIGKDYKFITLLENVTDPGNLGTIIRTAASVGCEAVLLSKGCVDVWSSKVLQAGQGAHFYIDIFPDFDLLKTKEKFDGKLLATMLDDKAQSLYKTDLTGKVAFLLGNEGAGISEGMANYCDKKVYIPMQNGFESLNVGVAAAMCFGEKGRQDSL